MMSLSCLTEENQSWLHYSTSDFVKSDAHSLILIVPVETWTRVSSCQLRVCFSSLSESMSFKNGTCRDRCMAKWDFGW